MDGLNHNDSITTHSSMYKWRCRCRTYLKVVKTDVTTHSLMQRYVLGCKHGQDLGVVADPAPVLPQQPLPVLGRSGRAGATECFARMAMGRAGVVDRLGGGLMTVDGWLSCTWQAVQQNRRKEGRNRPHNTTIQVCTVRWIHAPQPREAIRQQRQRRALLHHVSLLLLLLLLLARAAAGASGREKCGNESLDDGVMMECTNTNVSPACAVAPVARARGHFLQPHDDETGLGLLQRLAPALKVICQRQRRGHTHALLTLGAQKSTWRASRLPTTREGGTVDAWTHTRMHPPG